jgi:hypothetical protein
MDKVFHELILIDKTGFKALLCEERATLFALMFGKINMP